MKVFKAIPLASLQYGWDVLYPTKTELAMLERGQLSMLRIILGLPTRAPVIGIHYLLGTLPMQLLIFKKHLTLLHGILSLPDSAVPKSVFLYRYQLMLNKGYCFHIHNILSDLSLPSVVDLAHSLPTRAAWKATVKGSH